jgi:membrane protein required for colicin V production
MNINYFDIIFFVVIGIFVYKGVSNGLVMGVFSIVGLVTAFIVATKMSKPASEFIKRYITLTPLIETILAFVVVFFGIILIFKIAGFIMKKIVEVSLLGWLDKVGGGVFGLIKGGFILSLFLILMSFMPFEKEFEKRASNGYLYIHVRTFAPKVFDALKTFIPNTDTFYNEILNTFKNIQKDNKGSEILDFLKK